MNDAEQPSLDATSAVGWIWAGGVVDRAVGDAAPDDPARVVRAALDDPRVARVAPSDVARHRAASPSGSSP